jgi:hypothetical protein
VNSDAKLVRVDCPYCCEKTFALIPPGSDPVDTAIEADSCSPAEADTAVRTNCSDNGPFVVYLRK